MSARVARVARGLGAERAVDQHGVPVPLGQNARRDLRGRRPRRLRAPALEPARQQRRFDRGPARRSGSPARRGRARAIAALPHRPRAAARREAERRALGPARSPASMLPPMRSTMRREMASPRPVPPNLRVDAAVGLLEFLEDARLRVRRDADAGVAHREADLVGLGARLDDDGDAAALGELHRVAGEIEQHLAQPRGIAGHAGAAGASIDRRTRSRGPSPARAARAARSSPRPARRARTARLRDRAGRPRSWRSRGFPRSARAACRRRSSRPCA